MKQKRLMSLLLTIALVLSLAPVLSTPAHAASAQEITIGAGRIGNSAYKPLDMMLAFGNGTPGFSYTKNKGAEVKLGEGKVKFDTRDDWATFTINVNQNPAMKALCQSPTAELIVSGTLKSNSHYDAGRCERNYERTRIEVYKNGSRIFKEDSPYDYGKDDSKSYVSANISMSGFPPKIEFYNGLNISGASTIELRTSVPHDEETSGSTEMTISLYIQDKGIPTISGFSSQTNASSNASNNLVMKLGIKNADDPDNYYYDFDGNEYNTNSAAMSSRNWVQSNITFSKPVTMCAQNGKGGLANYESYAYNTLVKHNLFTNTVGTGYPGQGVTRFMELLDKNMNQFVSSLSYRYTATYGDNTGNRIIPNEGYIVSGATNYATMMDRIRTADFHDAAGNPLTVNNSVVNSSNNVFARGVIVDAVPPTYSKVGNGITPDILTGMVLNKNDVIPFVVEFSEEVQIKQGLTLSKTYLLMNNGGRAYYTGKSGKQWYFSYTVGGNTSQDAALLRAIALTNDALDGSLRDWTGAVSGRSHLSSHSFNVDGRVITDFTGNVMVNRANESDKTNTKQIQSSIDFAKLTIDNTPPSIALQHTVYGVGKSQATDVDWGQGAKVNVVATDPNVPVPKYDPEYSSGNTSKPSKGIFRPDSSAGVDASGVGLIFYTWSRSITPPDVGTNYEAIKRFSLAAIQPSEATVRSYAASWNGLTLRMANNYSEVQPPDEALDGTADGAWYLHVWTADMTWDSARQLMQYELSKALRFNSGFDEAKAIARKSYWMEEGIKRNFPSEEEAWNAKKQEVYQTAFTSQFLTWLDESGSDRYSDAAMSYADDLVQSQAVSNPDTTIKFNSANDITNQEEFDEMHTELVENYITANTPTEEAAWEAVKNPTEEGAESFYVTVLFDSEFAQYLLDNDVDWEEITDDLATEYAVRMAMYKTRTVTVTNGEGSFDMTERFDDTTAEAHFTDNGRNEASYKQVYSDDFLDALWDEVKEPLVDQEGNQITDGQGNPTYPDITFAEGSPLYTAGSNDLANAKAVIAQAVGTVSRFKTGVDGDAVRTAAIEQYISDNTPTQDEAEAEVKNSVLQTGYTSQFLYWMRSSGYPVELTGDALAAADEKMVNLTAQRLKYKDGYDDSGFEVLKMEAISDYRTGHSSASNAKKNNDAAWESVKNEFYTEVYTSEFRSWLVESGADMFSDDAMTYALSKALLQNAAYSDLTRWPWEKYNQEDSNWTYNKIRMLTDNTLPKDPVYTTDAINGQNTASVRIPVTLDDELSGLDASKVYYQWVKKGQSYTDVDWFQVSNPGEPITNTISDGLAAPNYGVRNITFVADTNGLVTEDGEYLLYTKCEDMAGNVLIAGSGDLTAVVNTTNPIKFTFGPEAALESYRKDLEATVEITGVQVGKLYWAVSDSPSRPEDSQFQEVTTQPVDGVYTIPTVSKDSGAWYLHIKVEEAVVGNTVHYSWQTYHLDTDGPEIYMNPNGSTEAQSVAVTVRDSRAGADSTQSMYQLSSSATPIDLGDENWLPLPSGGKVGLLVGEWYLHVKAQDKVGNPSYLVSELYSVSSIEEIEEAAPWPENMAYGCQLLTLEEEEEYAIAHLTLEDSQVENADLSGFRYSITTNGGATWCNWLPYQSMIRLDLSEGYSPSGLGVKFRSPDGAVGDPEQIQVELVADPVWATMEFDSLLKRSSAKTLTLTALQAEDVTVTSDDGLSQSGNTFAVNDNGVYTFTITGEHRTETLAVVVDLFDNSEPEAHFTYSDTAPVMGTVLVSLVPHQSVHVKSLMVQYDGEAETSQNPALQFSFRKNGKATFTIVSEAGVEKEYTATVSNLDNTPPVAKVTPYYDPANTVGEGASLVASRVTLAVEKTSVADEDFLVVNNEQQPTMEVTENGVYTFVIQDLVGNVSQVSCTVENILSTIPDCRTEESYPDGTPVTEGVWRKGTSVVKLIFDPLAANDGRKLYNGLVPTEYNELAKEGSNYVMTRTFSGNGTTYVAVCDDMGNVAKVPVTVTGLDNQAPTMTTEKSFAAIVGGSVSEGQSLTELLWNDPTRFRELFGEFTLSDNVYEPDQLTVTVAEAGGNSVTSAGQYTLRYAITDPAGNVGYALQDLLVLPADRFIIQADGVLLSSLSPITAILPDNEITFMIDPERIQAMFYGDQKELVHNSKMRYDLYYVGGLYREGQLKTIATQLTSEELTSQKFKMYLYEPGWYTIIIRNQERSREYTMFFVESVKQ